MFNHSYDLNFTAYRLSYEIVLIKNHQTMDTSRLVVHKSGTPITASHVIVSHYDILFDIEFITSACSNHSEHVGAGARKFCDISAEFRDFYE